MEKIRVRANKLGFFDTLGNGRFVEIKPGEEFEVPKGLTSKWFDPIEPPKAAEPPKGGGSKS